MNLRILCVLLTVFLIACGDDAPTAETIDCGQGESVTVDDELFCVFPQSVVVENGFDCPSDLPNLTRRAPIGVCAEDPDVPVEDLDRIDDQFRERRPDLYDDDCSTDLECGEFEVCSSGRCVDDPGLNNELSCMDSGDCDSRQICDQNVCKTACGGFEGLECEAAEWCDFPEGSICGGADEFGVCRPRPEVCTEEFAPVCGCDARTYSNECNARSEGVDIASVGECG